MDGLDINLWNEEQRARIEAMQWKVAQKLLQLGNIVIIEWGTWARSERDVLRLGARAVGAAVELRFLHAPIDVLMARLERRRMEDPPLRREQLMQWLRVFEPPSSEEMALFDAPPSPSRL
jgi:predicted kinase